MIVELIFYEFLQSIAKQVYLPHQANQNEGNINLQTKGYWKPISLDLFVDYLTCLLNLTFLRQCKSLFFEFSQLKPSFFRIEGIPIKASQFNSIQCALDDFFSLQFFLASDKYIIGPLQQFNSIKPQMSNIKQEINNRLDFSFTQPTSNNSQAIQSTLKLKTSSTVTSQNGIQQNQDQMIKSITTQNSSSRINSIDQNQCILEENEFSFFGNKKNQNTSKKQKYSHQSPSSVVLYALLFNHIYLQQSSETLPIIQNESERLISAFKEILINVEDSVSQNQKSNQFSAIRLIQCLHKNSGKAHKRQSELKSLLQKINSTSSTFAIRKLTEQLQGQSGKENIIQNGKIQSYSGQWKKNAIEELRIFALIAKVNIKVISGELKMSFGPRNAIISLIIKHKADVNLYSLSSISCVERHA